MLATALVFGVLPLIPSAAASVNCDQPYLFYAEPGGISSVGVNGEEDCVGGAVVTAYVGAGFRVNPRDFSTCTSVKVLSWITYCT